MELDCRQVVQRYADRLYRMAFSYCRNRPDAEDAVQEVFLRFLRRPPDCTDEEQLRRWLLKVTANVCRDMLRSPFRCRCCPLEEAAEPATLMEEESSLLSAVLRLPAKYRGIVHLYYYEDYSVAEVARIVGISESAVRMRLLRARRKLKEELEGEWTDEGTL